MKYGLPYKGSKNKLAKRILALMPRAEHFIDLFCGGCAVSHCALTMGKYPHVHVNDADWRPVTLFMDVLQGRYADEDRWISREDFARLKDKDPYVAVVWSFGNNMRDYLYSRDIEPLKRAIHYAIFYGDYAPGKELGHDLSFIDGIPSLDRRYIAVKRYFSQFGHFQQQSFEGGGTKQCGWNTSSERTLRLAYAKPGIGGGYSSNSEQPAYSVKRPSELQHLECRNRVDACIKKKKRIGEIRSFERRQSVSRWAHGRMGVSAPIQGATRLSASVWGGETFPSPRRLATMPTWRYPVGAWCIATFPTSEPVITTGMSISTISGFMNGAPARRNPSSSAVTTCRQKVSAASPSLSIGASFRKRETMPSRKGYSCRYTRSRRKGRCNWSCFSTASNK